MSKNFPKVPYKVVPLDSPVLRSPAVDVEESQQLTLHLSKGLKKALKKHSSGVGLALPQVGVGLRGFIIHAKARSNSYNQLKTRFCFNSSWEPSDSSSKIEYVEGCLSIEGGKKRYKMTRESRIIAKYINKQGRWVEEEMEGFLAIVFQHEHDHTRGVLISDQGELISDSSKS